MSEETVCVGGRPGCTLPGLHYHSGGVTHYEDEVTDAIAALREENERLRGALRKRVISGPNGVARYSWSCALCAWSWTSKESHAPGCLAAPPKEGE